MEIFLSMVSLVAMATQISMPCLMKHCFSSIFLQILTKYFKQLVILSLEVKLGIFFETYVTLHVICYVIGIAQCLS